MTLNFSFTHQSNVIHPYHDNFQSHWLGMIFAVKTWQRCFQILVCDEDWLKERGLWASGIDSDLLCICSCFTFVHPMILRPLGQWNGIWSWTKAYEIIWNHLNSIKSMHWIWELCQRRSRVRPFGAGAYAPHRQDGEQDGRIMGFRRRLRWRLRRRLWWLRHDCWMWICSFATLPSAWRDEPDPTRWAQMGPGTGHGSHGLCKRWPKICDFAKKSNHLAQKRMATNPIPTLCLFVVTSCT